MPLQHAYTSTVGAFSCEVEIDFAGIRGLVEDTQSDYRELAIIIVQQWADEVTAWMKENRPWSDDTTNARQSLGVVTEFQNEVITLILTGGVFYQKYLELLHGGRFRILQPAFHMWEPELRKRLGYEVEDEF